MLAYSIQHAQEATLVDRVLVSRVDWRARGRPGRVVDDAGGVDSRAVGPGVESKRRRPANLPSRARVDVDAGRSVRLARRVSVVHGG